MIFAGLSTLQLAAIFGGVGLAMVALYILKLRRRTVAVPFIPLWHRILKDKEATSLFSKLKRLLSLLLQLAILALLVLALGDPRARATLIKGRTLVVLLDASASMQATDGSPTRLDSGKDEVKTLIRGLGGADRMLIARMEAVTTPLGPLSSDTAELERALSEVRPSDARADFARGLRFAVDTLRGAENPEIIVVSDGGLTTPSDSSGVVHTGDIRVSYVPVGKQQRNVGVTQFSVRRYPLDKSRYEVMLEVTNTGPEVEDVELTLLGDGQVVDLTKLRLKAGERLPRFYPNLSGASRTLEARLRPLASSVDVLPADDHAFALLPERRRAKVLVVTAGNTYLEAALLLDEYLDVELATPKQYLDTRTQKKKHEVIIFDGVTPAEMPRAHAIYLDPRGPGSPVKVEAEIAQPGFDRIDRRHPIVRFMSLDDVNIARGRKLTPQVGDKVVGASDGGPILVTGIRDGFKFVALGFDPRDSDLPLRIAWPLLLLNSVNFFTDEDSSYLSSFRTGDVWRVPVSTDVRDAHLEGPFGLSDQVPVHEGRAVFQGSRAGFYELRSMRGQEEIKASFAANLLDVDESSVAPKPELSVDGKNAGRVSGFQVGVRREVWIYLLLAVILVAVLEWATYHRRITV